MKFKKLLYAILLMMWVVGIVGGVAFTIYYGGYVIAVGVAVAAWMSWQKVKEYFTILTL